MWLAIYQYPIHLGVHVFHALATALPDKKADTDCIIGEGNIHGHES